MKPDTNAHSDNQEEVRRSCQFGLLHFKPIEVPRPPADYGWNGESLKDFRRADQMIRDDHLHDLIVETLSVDLNLDPSQFEIYVNEGHVNLAGTLSDPSMKQRIEEMVRAVHGVKSVQNDLMA